MIDQAAHWAALLDAGDMNDEDRAAYEAWRVTHVLHGRTLDRMRAFDQRVENAAHFERDALRTVVERRAARRRRAGGALFTAILLATTGWAALQSDPIRDRFPDYQTERGELQTVVLADNSEIVIDTDAALRVDLEDRQRQVRLIRGQILVKVAHDPGRPFIVWTPDGTATALGTAFVVRRENDHTLVTVVESRVRLCPDAANLDDPRCRTIGAGERAQMGVSGIGDIAMVNADSASMWSSGWLEADDREVADVLVELSRYQQAPIRFDAASLRGFKVTGSFPLKDINRAIEGVARTAHLEVRHLADGEVVLSRRR